MKRLMLLALALFGLAFSASGVDAYGKVALEDFIGHRFILTTFNGSKPSAENEIFFQVDEEEMMSGKICNNFRGNVEIVYDLIYMKNAVSSRMACPDSGLSTLENRFLSLMEMGMASNLNGDELTLRRDDLILVFNRFYGLYATDAQTAPSETTPPADTTPAAAPAESAKAAPPPASADTETQKAVPAPVPAETAKAPVAPKPAEAAKQSAPSASDGKVTADALVGKKFVLKQVAGKDFKAERGKQPFIQFDDGMRVSGSACNNFTGPGELEGGILYLKNAAATMMMCVNEDLNKFERDFHQLLRTGAAIDLDGDTLTLTGDDIIFVYVLE